MKKPLFAIVAALPLLLTSCITDRYGSGWGEHSRWYPDGHVKNTYYGRNYYYDSMSVHDSHARLRGRHNTRHRLYGSTEDVTGERHGAWYRRTTEYYDPNSVHDAYARRRGRHAWVRE